MIMWDRKKAMMSIMAKRHPKDGEMTQAPMAPSEVHTDDGNADPRHIAAQDILMAIHEGHAEKLMEGLKAFIELHSLHGKSE